MHNRPHHLRGRHRAFTLTELLIVIGIMIIILAMGVPMFRFISGSNSVDGAVNQIKAELTRARSEAIGTGSNVGVVFYYDSIDKQYAMALVHQVSLDAAGDGSWDLDFMPDTDYQNLPSGVGWFGMTNALVSNAASARGTTDGYLHIGVIMYDFKGRLVTSTFRVLSTSKLVQRTTAISVPVPTEIGFVLFNVEAYVNKGFTWPPPADSLVSGGGYNQGTATDDATRDTWLDQYAQPYMLDRYSGGILEVPNL